MFGAPNQQHTSSHYPMVFYGYPPHAFPGAAPYMPHQYPAYPMQHESHQPFFENSFGGQNLNGYGHH